MTKLCGIVIIECIFFKKSKGKYRYDEKSNFTLSVFAVFSQHQNKRNTMKKKHLVLLSTTALLLAACGDDVTNVTNETSGVEIVSSS